MPQPTKPASVRIVQYWPRCQRLLMPMAQPFLNWIGREMVRGSGSFMTFLQQMMDRLLLGLDAPQMLVGPNKQLAVRNSDRRPALLAQAIGGQQLVLGIGRQHVRFAV